MSYSFRDVVMDGRIWSPETGRVASLSVQNPERNSVSAIPFLSSIGISIDYGYKTDLTANFAVTYDDAIRLMDEEPWLRLNNTLGLRWGYNDGIPWHITDWYFGLMQMPEPSFGEEISLSVRAIGVGKKLSQLSSKRVWSTPERPRTFKSIAEEIAKKYGLVVDEKMWGLISAQKASRIEEERFVYNQAGLSDLQFLNDFAKRSGLQLIIRGGRMMFVDRLQPLLGEPEVSAEFRQYGEIDTENNIYPIAGFTPTGFGSLFLPHHQGLQAFVEDPNLDPEQEREPIISTDKTGQETKYSGPDSLNVPTPDGKQTSTDPDAKIKAGVVPNSEYMEAGKCVPIVASSEYMRKSNQEYLDSVREANAEDQGIGVTFESVAIPTLVPGMLIRLSGVGSYYSTDYLLRKMTVGVEGGGANATYECTAKGFPSGVDFNAEPVPGTKEFEVLSSEERSADFEKYLFGSVK